jgi:hypothetical protein
MSKHINMTGHYKVAGRDRQGEGILQSSQKGAYAQQRHEARLQAIEAQAGPPAWETTPPNLEIEERVKPRTPRKARRTRSTKKTRSTRSGKATGKAALRRKAVSTRSGKKRQSKRVSARAAR